VTLTPDLRGSNWPIGTVKTLVQVAPCVSAVESPQPHAFDLAWIEVPKVDVNSSVPLRIKRLPMGHAAAVLAPYAAQCAVAPNVFVRVLRITDHLHSSNRVERPKAPLAPADRTIAKSYRIWKRRDLNLYGPAVACSSEHVSAFMSALSKFGARRRRQQLAASVLA
jgi:hypothetical protein